MKYFAAALLSVFSSLALCEPLAIVCNRTIPENSRVTVCGGGLYESYERPLPGSLVRLHPGGEDPWSNPLFQYRKFSSIKDTEYIEVCDTEGVAPGTKVLEKEPWDFARSPCQNWRRALKTELGIPKVNATGTFDLVWTAPTVNEDGSALTDLAGYWVYSGANGSALSRLRQVDKAASKLSLTGYGAGSYQFALTALNAKGEEGPMSNTASITVEIRAKRPGAPTAVSITGVTVE